MIVLEYFQVFDWLIQCPKRCLAVTSFQGFLLQVNVLLYSVELHAFVNALYERSEHPGGYV